jgi:hypothetical protein
MHTPRAFNAGTLGIRLSELRQILIVSQERGSNVLQRRLKRAGKLHITFDARSEEILHVVRHGLSDDAPHRLNCPHLMPASKIDANWGGGLDGQTLLQERPTRRHVVTGAGKFEIVDINHQVQLERTVEVARRPLLRDGQESNCSNMLVTMLFPEGPAVRMAIKGLLELHHGAAHTHHFLRPLIGRQTNPARSSRELCLDVCLLSVGDLDTVAGGRTVAVSGP